MPPRPIPLAYSGRKLTGPPEGYDKKKELQVKKWLVSLPGTDASAELPASVASASEVGGQLDASLDELYGDLRDSTEGDFPPQGRPKNDSKTIAKPDKQIPKPVEPGVSVPLPQQHPSTPPPPLNVSAAYVGLSAQPTLDTAAVSPAGRAVALSNSSFTTDGLGTGNTTPSVSLTPTPHATPAASPALPAARIPVDLVAPLEFVLNGLGPDPVAVGRLGMALDTETEKQSIAVSAGLLVARAEAALAAQAPAAPGSSGAVNLEVEKYKAALLMAVREQQRLAEEVRGELAAARAASDSSTRDAAQKAAGAAADAAAAAQRAAAAEAQLAQVRAEVARFQQDAKVARMDAEDREEEHKEEVVRLQGEVAAALARLTAQGDSREMAIRQAQEEAATARQAAAAIDRQYKHLKRQYDLDKSRLNMEVASLKAELQARDTDIHQLRADKQQALTDLQAEVTARVAAEASEAKALKAAYKQVEVAESLAAARQASLALKQQVELAGMRGRALRGDTQELPAAGAAGAVKQAARPIKPEAGAAPSSSRTPSKGGAPPGSQAGVEAPVGSPAVRPAGGGGGGGGGEQFRGQGPTRGAGGRPDASRAALELEFDESEIRRLEAHRDLSQALAVERAQLGELHKQQKRAVLAAQLSDTKAVQQALAAAPEHLRVLGLAFRASLVGLPSHFSDAASLGSHTLVTLTSAGYRCWADPVLITPQPPPLPVVPGLSVPPTAPMVPISGAVLLIASTGLLASPTHLAAVTTAIQQGVPLHILAPSKSLTLDELFLDPLLPGVQPTIQKSTTGDQAAGLLSRDPAGHVDLSVGAKASLEAAWKVRIVIGGESAAASQLPAGGGGQAPSHLVTLRSRLGVSDSELQGLPLELLKRMSIERNLAHPDLRYFNCPRVSHLKVTLHSSPAAETDRRPSPQRLPDSDRQSPRTREPPGGGEPGAGAGGERGMRLDSLIEVVRHNTMATALTVKGASMDAARAVCAALASSPASCVTSFSVGAMEIPVGGLLSRTGVPPLQALDLSQAGDAFSPEVAATLDAALSCPTSTAPAHLTSIDLPPVLSAAFHTPHGQEAVARLAATLFTLTQPNKGVLQALNKCPVSKVASKVASKDTPGAPPGKAQESQGVLDLSGCHLGPIATAVLMRCAAASGCLAPGLQALNLTGCQIGPSGATQLAAITAGGGAGGGGGGGSTAGPQPPKPTGGAGAGVPLRELKVACLSDNRLGVQGLAALCPALTCQGSSSTCGITVLDLSVNHLADEGMKVLSSHLKSMQQLEVLLLAGNYIQVDGAKSLAAGLPQLTALKQLHLAANTIGDAGAVALADAAVKLKHLAVLHLNDNYSIGTEGARALGSLLTSSTSLTDLHLASNHLGVEGARQLAIGLAMNKSLTRLELARCKLRCEGVAHLAAALTNNTRLLDLGLSRNGAGDLGTKSLVEALQRNRHLTRLDLRGNSLGLVGCRLLGTLLKERNDTLVELRLLREGAADPETDRPVFKALEVLAATSRSLPPPKRPLSSRPSGGSDPASLPPLPAALRDTQPQADNLPVTGASGRAAGSDASGSGRAQQGSAHAVQAVDAAHDSTTASKRQLPYNQDSTRTHMSSDTSRVKGQETGVSVGSVTGAPAGSSSSRRVGDASEEDLEHVLARYRTAGQRVDETGAGGKSGEEGFKGFLNYGYTGVGDRGDR